MKLQNDNGQSVCRRPPVKTLFQITCKFIANSMVLATVETVIYGYLLGLVLIGMGRALQ